MISPLRSTFHEDYSQRVGEYVAWRKASHLGRVSMFVSAAKLAARRERGRALLDRQAARARRAASTTARWRSPT